MRRRSVQIRYCFTRGHLLLSFLVVSGSHGGRQRDESDRAEREGYLVDGQGNVRVSDSAVVRSDLNSTGDLWVGKGAIIEGDASVEGDLVMERDSRIRGSIKVKGSVNFRQNALVLGTVEIGGTVFRGDNPPDTFFRKGSGNVQGEGLTSAGGGSTVEEPTTALVAKKLQGGSVAVIHEKRTEVSYAVLRRKTSEGIPCMIIGREPPERLKLVRKIAVEEENVIWLTNLVGKRCVNPTHLGSVLNAISKFLETNREGLVLIDGIEYLITNNGFDQVLKFINKIEDMIITSGIAVLVTLDPRTMDAQNLALIERGAEAIFADDRLAGDTISLRQEFDERLREESVRRQQLEDRLDSYLFRIESAISAAQSRPVGEHGARESDIAELENTRDEIRTEIRTLEQRIDEKERDLIEALEKKIGEIRGESGRKDLAVAMEEQLRENSELLLKAVLLAEKLSYEKLHRLENSVQK